MYRVRVLFALAILGVVAGDWTGPASLSLGSQSGRLSIRAPRKTQHSSLRLRGGDDAQHDVAQHEPRATDVNADLQTDWVNDLPELRVDNIAKFNNWDHRECCVGNADEWQNFMTSFLARPQGFGKIPKKIHQIWIGPKQPPIVWVDTWRKKYRSQYPGWDYQLWTDKEVAELELRTQDLYDQERMYQCKADLLRLEVLWKEGGVYIDADMVWLHKDLQDVLDKAKDTGFFCGYEPDTKDKPYSVIGNSFIACTPKHPLVDMLIKYIKAVYPHKRPYHGVEWVTGPLAFTKCISHTKMPWFVPPQIWFYPAFHYIPNPDAINLRDFPHSYAFQFGYTCSGLEGWVANSIRRCTLDNFWLEKCPQLKDLEWPLGKLKPLPERAAGEDTPAGKIPKVIHQFAFQGAKPDRWIQTWAEDFCRENEGWEYKCWTDIQQLKGDYFCCNMYSDQFWQMDPLAMQLLALEVLYQHGGFHVPLAVPWAKHSTLKALAGKELADRMLVPTMDPTVEDSCFSAASVNKGFVEADGLRIFGAAPGHAKLLSKIKDLIMLKPGALSARYIAPSDAVAAYLDFPSWTRFLGADEIFDLCNSPASDRATLSWSYDSMVPSYALPREHRSALRGAPGRFVAITDAEVFHHRALTDAVPGFIQQMDGAHGEDGWDFVLLMLQWQAGQDGSALYEQHGSALPNDSRVVGILANRGRGAKLPQLSAEEDNWALVDFILQRAGGELKVGIGAERFVHDRQLSAIYRGIPSVQHAFKALANGHEPPLDHDSEERNGNTLKAMKNGQVRYEMQVDGEHRVSFRAFNDDGGMNCEVRLQDGHAGKRVEFIKVFFNHQLVFEKQNQMC